MKTLFIGDFSSSSLMPVAALKTSIAHFPTAEVFVHKMNEKLYARNVPQAKLLEPGTSVDRVVVCGNFGHYLHWKEALTVALEHQGSASVGVFFHNFSFPFVKEVLDPTAEERELFNASTMVARDHRTIEAMAQWLLPRFPSMIPYAERNLPVHGRLIPKQDVRKLVGLSFRTTPSFVTMMENNPDELIKLLTPYQRSRIVPLVVEPSAPDAVVSDIKGIKQVIELCLPDAEIIHPELLDHEWATKNLTPERLKGLCLSCDVIVAQQEVPVAFASAGHVQTFAVGFRHDNNAFRALASLAEFTHERSHAVLLD
jgi:hypothetical protein